MKVESFITISTLNSAKQCPDENASMMMVLALYPVEEGLHGRRILRFLGAEERGALRIRQLVEG